MNTPVSVSLNNDAAQASSDARLKRMLSVDALRGFDMFWIIGGEEVAKALEALGGGCGAGGQFQPPRGGIKLAQGASVGKLHIKAALPQRLGGGN